MNEEFSARYDANKISAGWAFFWWFILGSLGGYRFYLRHHFTAMTMAALSVGGVFLLWTNFSVKSLFPSLVVVYHNESLFAAGKWMLIGVTLWWLADVFFIHWLVRRYNNRLVDSLKEKGEHNV